MKFTAAILTLIASSGIVNALPEAIAGGGGWGKHHSLTSSCWTSSTCKASYYYETETRTKPVTVGHMRCCVKVIKSLTQFLQETYTVTVYKPTTVETEVPKTYTKTEYSKRLNCFSSIESVSLTSTS